MTDNVLATCEPTERSEGGLQEAEGANATGAQVDLLHAWADSSFRLKLCLSGESALVFIYEIVP